MGELGTRGTTERVPVGNSPPKVALAALLPDDAVSRGAPRQLSAPRAQQAPQETDRDRVAGPQGLALSVPYAALPGTTAEGFAGVCVGPKVTSLCGSRRYHGWSSQWQARATVVPREESGLVRGARRPRYASAQHAAGSSP